MAFGFDDLAAIGSFIGGVGQAAGGVAGLFNGGSGASQYQQNLEFARQQLAFQDAAAKNGIRWRVEDARLAGVSPLVALGAPTFNPSPVMVSGTDGTATDWAGSFRNMGQGLDRAFAATQSKEERAVAKYATIDDLLRKQQLDDSAVERATLQNDLLKLQIASEAQRLNRTQVGPPMPGIGNSSPINSPDLGVYKVDPAEVTNTQPNSSGTSTAGPPIATTTWEKTPTGIAPSLAKGSIQDTDIFNPEYMKWALRNYAFPHPDRAPTLAYMQKFFPGAIGVRWDQWNLEYRPVYPPGGRIK